MAQSKRTIQNLNKFPQFISLDKGPEGALSVNKAIYSSLELII